MNSFLLLDHVSDSQDSGSEWSNTHGSLISQRGNEYDGITPATKEKNQNKLETLNNETTIGSTKSSVSSLPELNRNVSFEKSDQNLAETKREEENKRNEVFKKDTEHEAVVVKRDFRPRRPEQTRPYTYDFLRHQIEFKRIGLVPITVPHGFSSDRSITSKSSHKPVNVIVRNRASSRKPPLTSTHRFRRYRAVISDSDDDESNTEQDHSKESNLNTVDNDLALSSTVEGKKTSTSKEALESESLLSDSDQSMTNISSNSTVSDLNLKTLKKRLRGVLPPSFLTLQEKKNLENRGVKKKTSLHKGVIEGEKIKGVARRKLHPRSTAKLSSELENEKLDSDNSISTPTPTDDSRFDTNEFLDSISRDNGWLKEDVVDQLWLPKRSLSALKKPSSLTSENPFQLNVAANAVSTIPVYRTTKTKMKKNRFKYVEVEKLPDLILESHGKKAPKFLRVFARSSSHIPKMIRRKRQMDSKKYFSFDKESDRQVIDQVLSDWYSGKHELVRQSHSYKKPSDSKSVGGNIFSVNSKKHSVNNNTKTAANNGLSHLQNFSEELLKKRKLFSSLFSNNVSYKKSKKLKRTHTVHDKCQKVAKLDHYIRDNIELNSKEREHDCYEGTLAVTQVNTEIRKPSRKQKAQRFIRDDFDTVFFQSSSNPNYFTDVNPFWNIGIWSTTFNVITFRPGLSLPNNSFIKTQGLNSILQLDILTHPFKSVYAFSCLFNIQDDVFKTFEKLKDTFETVLENLPYFTNSETSDLYNLLSFCSAFILHSQVSMGLVNLASSFLETYALVNDRVSSISGLNRSQLVEKIAVLFQTFQVVFYCEFELGNQQNINKVSWLASDLISKLLSAGQSGLLECYRNLRIQASDTTVIDTLFLESWSILNHILFHVYKKKYALWEQVNLFFDLQKKELSILEMEKIWYVIMTLNPVFQIGLNGTTHSPGNNSFWPLIIRVSESAFKMHKDGHNVKVVERYLRTVFLRIHFLISEWRWEDVAQILFLIFDFFSHRKFNDLSSEISEDTPTDFPDFVKSLDRPPNLHVTALDTCFVIYLKVILISISRLRQVDENTNSIKRIVSRLQPLHSRQYTRESPFSIKDFMSLEHTHTLLICLYWAAPENCRPSLNRIRDIVIVDNSHLKARLISLKAWLHLMKYVIKEGSDYELAQGMEWFNSILKVTFDEYLAFFSNGTSVGEMQLAEYSKHQLENALIVAFHSLQDLIPNSSVYISRINVLVTEQSCRRILKDSHFFPPRVTLECILFLKKFLQYQSNTEPPKVTVVGSTSHDSQDAYFDSDVLDDNTLILEQEKFERKYEVAQILRTFVSPFLYQTISYLVGNDEDKENYIRILLLPLMECMAICASFAVEAKINDWSYYIDFGSESWERIRNTPLKRSLSTTFYSFLISYNDSFIKKHEEKVLTVWFESLGALDEDHAAQFTILLLQKNLKNPILLNLPISVEIEEISINYFKSVHLNLLTAVFCNMAKLYADAKTNGFASSQYLQSLFIHYLSSLLSSMQHSYETNGHSSDSHSLFVINSQRVVGDILQYCSQFANDRNLPALRYFMDSTKFPQPPERLEYTALRLRSYARKTLTNSASQNALFSFLKANFDVALLEQKQTETSNLLRLAMGFHNQNSSSKWDVEISSLRKFCVKELLLSYLGEGSLAAMFYSLLLLEGLSRTYNSFRRIYLQPYIQQLLCEEISVFVADLEKYALLYENKRPLLSGRIYYLISSFVAISMTNKTSGLPSSLICNLQNFLARIARDFLLELCWNIEGSEFPPPYNTVDCRSKFVKTIQQHCSADWYDNVTNIVHKSRKKKLFLPSQVEQEEEYWSGLMEVTIQIWKHDKGFLEPELDRFLNVICSYAPDMSGLPTKIKCFLDKIGYSWMTEENDFDIVLF